VGYEVFATWQLVGYSGGQKIPPRVGRKEQGQQEKIVNMSDIP
jgi:hypothetical protein